MTDSNTLSKAKNFVLDLYRLHNAKKQLKSAIKHAKSVLNMQRDVAGDEAAANLEAEIATARRALKSSHDSNEVVSATEKLCIACDPKTTVWKPLFINSIAENFEVIVVALSVAMAFRCYFFQPFKIPTGSMQPTLYGIHSSTLAAADTPSAFDQYPLKFGKWLITGDWYEEVRTENGGRLSWIRETVEPGYISYRIGGQRCDIPSESVSISPNPQSSCFEHKIGKETVIFPVKNSAGIMTIGPSTKTYPPGAIIWRGIIHAGDHVFVNRISWNFRKPHRGEVMIFTTNGIKGLPDGTHYIKRMVGLPGEKISIEDPFLLVNGEKVTEPKTIGRIVRKEPAPYAEPGYPNFLGYQLIGKISADQAPSRSPLRVKGDSIQLDENEYLGMGDNTGNSYDGRYWGPVPDKNLLGPGAIVYWPFTSKRFGFIE